MATEARTEPRGRLRRERVLKTAMGRADHGGLEALTMRSLADELGVAPMALYRHIANKDDLIDAMIDTVFSEIGLPRGRCRVEDRHARSGEGSPRRLGVPPLGRSD